MRRFGLLSSALLLTCGAGTAFADGPAPQFASVGGRDAVLFYTDTPSGYQVVITFAANKPDDGTSMRSVVTLLPGQQSTLSVGGDVNTKPATLTIRRDGDRLVVLPPEMQTSSAR
jgi:hypothetical protein